MAASTEVRRREIGELIRSRALSSQEELAHLLAERGFSVTQATVSRDLEQLGAVKVRRGGEVAYALPDQLVGVNHSAPRLDAIIRDWVRSVEVAGNLVVMKTPAGSAHLVGVALDQSRLAEIVGTICGDDTIFVACATASAAKRLADRLESPGSGGRTSDRR